MSEEEKCCDNCDNYKDALCQMWFEGDTVGIEDIESPDFEVCKNWEGNIDDT